MLFSSSYSAPLILATFVLTLSRLALASPLPGSPSYLFSRQNDQCFQDNYTQCPGSDLPGSFCCGEDYDCITLAGRTSVLCCPKNDGCEAVTPMDCDIDWEVAMKGSFNRFYTTATDQDLPVCGAQCCPFGYHCGVNSDKAIICLRNEDQSLAPGILAAPDSTTTQPESTDVVTYISYTQGSYPTHAGGDSPLDQGSDEEGKEPKRAGIIVGATVAGFCSASGLFIYLWVVCRRQRKGQTSTMFAPNSSRPPRKQKKRSLNTKTNNLTSSPTIRPHTPRSTNTEAVEEKYGIRVHDCSPPPPPPLTLPMAPGTPASCYDITSPTSPGVTEFINPARVFRKDTRRKERRIKVLNISTKLLPPPTELPASPVSLRYFGPNPAPSSTSISGTVTPQTGKYREEEEEEDTQETHLKIPRGRKSMASIKTFGRSLSRSPAAVRQSLARPRSSQSIKHRHSKTPDQGNARRSKSYEKLSLRQSFRKSTASWIPILSANFASSPRTAPIPPVPIIPNLIRESSGWPMLPELPPPTSAVSPHPPVFLNNQSNEQLGGVPPPPPKSQTPPLEQEDGPLPEVVTPEMMKQMFPEPERHHLLWRPSSAFALGGQMGSGGHTIRGSSSKGSIVSESGHSRGSLRGGDGLIGKNRQRITEFRVLE